MVAHPSQYGSRCLIQLRALLQDREGALARLRTLSDVCASPLDEPPDAPPPILLHEIGGQLRIRGGTEAPPAAEAPSPSSSAEGAASAPASHPAATVGKKAEAAPTVGKRRIETVVLRAVHSTKDLSSLEWFGFHFDAWTDEPATSVQVSRSRP